MRSFSFKDNGRNPKTVRRNAFNVLPILIAMLPAILFQGCNLLPEVPADTSHTSSVAVLEYGKFYYDLVIYGGTPSGLCAAIAASREGLDVAIIEPSSHIGGIITGGLCSSDIGNQNVIGGLAKEFFVQIGTNYNDCGFPVYSFEPHKAEAAFVELAAKSDVNIFYNERLKENGGVQKIGDTITSVTTEAENVYFAEVFIDCTYEGDLMAMSGVSYTLGREGTDVYGETLAGIRPFIYINNFDYSVPAFDWNNNKLLPGVSTEIFGNIGQGDSKLPAYNYRLCITDVPENRVEFAKPDSFDASQYELLLIWLYTMWSSEGYRKLTIDDVLSIGRLPGEKVDVNNKGPFSSDFIGQSWDYPESSYKTREYICKQHQEYLQGFLYFLANDRRVPFALREDLGSYGLAADEFTDNGNWPYQLYVRESRRMTSDFVMTQHDLQTNREKNDSIGMGSYPIDSHHVQRVSTSEGVVKNEGEVLTWIDPYQLPYRIIVPKKNEAVNLLVPVCVSASHVAFSSLRMEPQYMIMGEAAGLAAKLAIEQNCSVQKINTAALRTMLEGNGAVLSLP